MQCSAVARVSISSGQRNLMKTYHNEANTGGITKIALKFFFWTFSDKGDRVTKFLTFKVIFLRQELSKSF